MKTIQTVNDLAIRVCRAIREVRQDQQSWIGIDRLHDHLGQQNLYAVDAAVAFAKAKAKGWLAISGAPADRVLLRQGAP